MSVVGPLKYQSPINLDYKDISFDISQCLKVKGKNKFAELNHEKHIFEVKDKVILKIENERYQLVEYHFHLFPGTGGCTGSEHTLKSKRFDSEVHFVFTKLGKDVKHIKCNHNLFDVCSGKSPSDAGDLLVIGRFIKFGDKTIINDLHKLQVKLPEKYFEYDGALTAPLEDNNFSSVRWLVGTKPVELKKEQLSKDNAKTTRCIQPLDGRIILFSCN